LDGYNATVFAYGATGAGKTFTMLGEAHSPGLMLMTLGGLFSLVEELSLERDYQVKLSYLEIYNEVIRDLLNPSKSMLDIREDPAKGVMVANLTEIMPNTPEEVVDSIRKGNKRRTCEPTEANKTSSRSHAVLQIFVQQRDKAYDINSEVAVGKLSLIDLAGSERASNTKNRGMRLIEGANINKSLLSLANCINALCDANEKDPKVHIPYKDSKLTRLLKDSLGGNCRTVMVACISPYSGTYEDTHNTLEYANRAKNIKTKLHRNVVNVSHHISKYTVIISELRKEISHLRKSLKDSKTPSGSSGSEIQNFSIELNNHFKQEAKLRKSIHETEMQKAELEFQLFNKQLEYKKNSNKSLSQEINKIKSDIQTRNNSKENLESRLKQLESKRSFFYENWTKAGLREPYLTKLQVSMQQHAINLDNKGLQMKKSQDQAAFKQKELYIQLLEDQLRIRDNILSKQENFLSKKKINPPLEVQKAYKELQTIDEINSSMSKRPDNAKSQKFKKETKLPSLSPTRFKQHLPKMPRRNSGVRLSSQSKGSKTPIEKDQKLSISTDSDKNFLKPPDIASRFSNSPYVNSSKNSSTRAPKLPLQKTQKNSVSPGKKSY